MILEGFLLFVEVLLSTAMVFMLPIILFGLCYEQIKEMLNDDWRTDR